MDSTLSQRCVLSLLMMFTGFVGASGIIYQYEDDPVPNELIRKATDLQQDGRAADDMGAPLLIEFSAPWCTYCEVLEQQVLEPMLRNSDYDESVIIRKVEVAETEYLRDFSGRQVNAVDFGSRQRVDIYPTLVLFDGKGREIGQRIVGITVLEYVPDRIDRSIALAQRQLRERTERID